MRTSIPSSSGSQEALQTTVAGETVGDPTGPPPDAPNLDRGAHLGRYTVLERIGAGGMGVVYGAFDPQLDRKIALKVMHPNMRGVVGSSGGRSRLLREAQAMAKLSHPNVITVHDVGTFGERVFVAMEFIDGSTLREWLTQSHREWAEIIEAFVKAGRGLAAAHAAGLVHRDFKPDNVLIGRDGRVLVMDFGLARTAGTPQTSVAPDQVREMKSAGDMVLTRTGALLGTPAYMAPEQHKGGKPDPHADQFSFCVALYEALYGERPFDGNSVTSLAMNVLDGQLRTPPKNSGVPSWLRDVVVRGLSTDPEDRWQSMDALLAELQRDPVEKRPPWVAVGAALGVGGLITVAYLASRPPVDDRCAAGADEVTSAWNDERNAAVQAAFAGSELGHAQSSAQTVAAAMNRWSEQWRAAYTEICHDNVRPAPRGPDPEDVPGLVCLQVTKTQAEALVDAWTTADPLAVLQAPRSLASLPEVAPCANAAGLVASDMHPTARQLEIRRELATAHAQLAVGHPSVALQHVEGLASGAQALDDAGLHAHVLLARARSNRALGQRRQAESELRTAVVLASSAEQPSVEAAIWIELAALVGHDRDRLSEGRQLLLAADAALARTADQTRLSVQLAVVRGRIAAAAGRYDRAADAFIGALSTLNLANIDDAVWTAAVLSDLGLAQEGLGLFEAATASHGRALQEREQLLGTQHPLVGLSLGQLGTAMLGADFPRKADASFVRARWVLDHPAQAGPWPPVDPSSTDGAIIAARIKRDLASVEDRAGLLHRGREEFADAERAHQRAVDLLEPLLAAQHRDLGYPLNNLGLALADQGRHREALVPLRRALTVWTDSLPLSHPDLAVAHLNVGNALWALGQYVEAQMEYTHALDVWERTLPPEHPLLGYALTGVGRCALASDDPATAIEHLERALAIRDSEAEDKLNLAETSLILARALWAASLDPTRARELANRARDLVGAYEPSDPAGVDALLDGADVPRLTDQLVPAGLGTTNRNPATYR